MTSSWVINPGAQVWKGDALGQLRDRRSPCATAR